MLIFALQFIFNSEAIHSLLWFCIVYFNSVFTDSQLDFEKKIRRDTYKIKHEHTV